MGVWTQLNFVLIKTMSLSLIEPIPKWIRQGRIECQTNFEPVCYIVSPPSGIRKHGIATYVYHQRQVPGRVFAVRALGEPHCKQVQNFIRFCWNLVLNRITETLISNTILVELRIFICRNIIITGT